MPNHFPDLKEWLPTLTTIFVAIFGFFITVFGFVGRHLSTEIKLLKTQLSDEVTKLEADMESKVPYSYIREEIKTVLILYGSKLDRVLEGQGKLVTREEHLKAIAALYKNLDRKQDKA